MSARWSLLMIAICLLYRLGSSHVSAQTTAQCGRPTIENLERLSPDWQYYYRSALITVQCKPGYYPSSASMRCSNPRMTQEWSPPTVTCIAQCGRPTIANLGSLSADKEYYDSGEVIIVHCKPGYYPSSAIMTCSNPRTAQEWSPPTVTCIERCKRPDQDKPYTFYQDRDYYNPGEEVAVLCKEEGHRSSPAFARCVASVGRYDWNPSPSCIERCKRPDQDEPYTFSKDKDYYNPEDWVKVLCKEEGHRPSPEYVTCVTSVGRDDWDKSPSCIAQCGRPTIENLERLSPDWQYYYRSALITVQCKPGYYPSSASMRCSNPRMTQEWSPPTVTCIAQCGRPTIANLGSLSADWQYYDRDTEITVQCKPGYYPSSAIMTCSNPRTAQEWSPPTVTCIERCKRPDQDKPYTFYQDRDYYNPGEEVAVLCKEEGHRSSPAFARCVASVGRYDWNPSPSCIERCKRPDQDEPYTFSKDKDYYNPEDWVKVLCKEEGHRPSPEYVTCVTSVGRDDWDKSPSCIAQCRRPTIENLERLSADKQYYDRREVITVHCKPGYYPSSARMTCSNPRTSQQWTPPTVTCIGVTVPDVAATSTSISFWISCSPECPPGWGFTTICCDETTSPPSCNTSSDGRNVTFSSLQPLALYRITTTLHRDGTSHLVWSSNVTAQEPDLSREGTDNLIMELRNGEKKQRTSPWKKLITRTQNRAREMPEYSHKIHYFPESHAVIYVQSCPLLDTDVIHTTGCHVQYMRQPGHEVWERSNGVTQIRRLKQADCSDVQNHKIMMANLYGNNKGSYFT
ncbi:C4b-binding protein alpha chain-like isoform X2 [Hyperolius riggenbachi]|uniref:C4b-binding protein alpha chain-like isoform X2 n=1 Tax=Hyperolius riggenbachi TaxID=752182 RepID=UPI0035A27626